MNLHHPHLFLFFGLMVFLPCLTSGQMLFNMGNQQTDECKGILLDSDAGATAGDYDHNEDYTFTICVPGADYISISFSSFCTEQDYDVLRLFDGADTLATQLGGNYSGTNIPPTLTTSGECLTVHFKSDANVACAGWVAQWTTKVLEPILPEMTFSNTNPSCSTSVLTVNFDQPIPCDSLIASAFSITGPFGNAISSVSPINCTNDSSTQAHITLSDGLNASGFYELTYSSFFLDQCDSLWTLTTTDTLLVNDCPILVDILSNTQSICVGECVNLTADARNGDLVSYTYAWNNGLPASAGPHLVCPTTTTTYTVTVSDNSGSIPGTNSVTIAVLPAPSITTAPASLCQSDPPTQLTAMPSGGSWSGQGITDPNLGMFHPDSAGGGTHTITYTAPNECTIQTQINVISIWAGFDEAACPGSAPFALSGFSPPGGTWSGMNVSPNGIFTPPITGNGSFPLTYTVNGCSDTRFVHTANPATNVVDTVCQSLDPFNLGGSPAGGRWSGPGITNSVLGLFDPSVAGPGSHTLTYSLNGCSTSEDIFVKTISAGNDFVACPDQTPFTLSAPNPAGGTWSSLFGAMVDPQAGLFDPGATGNNFTDTLTYTVSGCTATRIAYVRQTRIYLNPDTLYFCRDDAPLSLNWTNTRRSPWNGDWSGPGVTDPDWPGTFDPFVAGHGTHTLIYDANTCVDSMVMVVHPREIFGDTSVCQSAAPFQIQALNVGGVFSGNGISDPVNGFFDPSQAGIGMHKVYHQSVEGCWDSMQVEVYALPVLSIDNLQAAYCYKDTLYQLQAQPAGGTFTGPGIVGNGFNPVLAGSGGPYQITYAFGSGDCEQTVLGITAVGDPLKVSVAFDIDTICGGEYINVSANGSGGNGPPYTYSWNEGLGNGPDKPVNPSATTTYEITFSDGCSDPVKDSSTVFVNPPFDIEVEQSEPVCFGEMGFAVARVNGPSEYELRWNTSPAQFGDTLHAPTGFNYRVTATDIYSACVEEAVAEIPRYPFVRAAFAANPATECVLITDPVIGFLDQSTGGFEGIWDFGDGNQAPYISGISPDHAYDSLGEFRVKLYIQNEGGCADSSETSVCVVPPESYFEMPDAFSPNGDGINDEFYIVGQGITSFQMIIYNRWGYQVYQTEDPDFRWDGLFEGKKLPTGVYVFVVRGYITSNLPSINYRPQPFVRRGTVSLVR